MTRPSATFILYAGAPDMLERILLVDDSENDALLLQRALKSSGLADPVVWLSDSRQARAYLAGEGPYGDREQYPLPNILLLDMLMPVLDGLELLKWVKAQPPLNKIVVIMVSHLDDVRRIQLAYQLGAHSYLDKGGSPEEFSNFVQFAKALALITKAPATHLREQQQSKTA